MRSFALAATLTLSLGACSEDGNFSQHPGFAAWYASHPPSDALPDAAGRTLLARYRPRVFLPTGNEGPIDFYRDYVAQGRLLVGETVLDKVDQAVLNQHKRDPTGVFEHVALDRPVHPVIYGRIDRSALPGCAPLTFLTYNLVFRHSGLPAALPWWQAAALGLVGDLDDWHQLDHYVAMTLALTPEGGHLVPFAVTFQQHNYLRSYLLGAQDGPGRLALPADGRIAVDVAIRSNELYPHRPGRVQRRAVSFMSAEAAGYLVSGENPPWRAADDVTEPAHAIDPELVFLPPADAFYVFQGWLGERRMMPGRDGPPGADYNTLPAFKDKAVQLAMSYWYEGDADYPAMLGALFADGRPQVVDVAPFAERIAGAGGPAAVCAASTPASDGTPMEAPA